jgi:hypothetical protein
MTQAELRFLESVPARLRDLTEAVKELTDAVRELKDKQEQ